jgi:hypothetical protein
MQAKRQLAGFLIDELKGNKPAMRDVLIRDVPARTLLTIAETRTAADIGAFAGPLFGLFWGSGRPFLRYHAEVTNDTEGPVRKLRLHPLRHHPRRRQPADRNPPPRPGIEMRKSTMILSRERK